MADRVEFYDGDKLVSSVDSSIVPRVGQYINIRKRTWCVERVSYALDNSDDACIKNRVMRANVDLILLRNK